MSFHDFTQMVLHPITFLYHEAVAAHHAAALLGDLENEKRPDFEETQPLIWLVTSETVH